LQRVLILRQIDLSISNLQPAAFEGGYRLKVSNLSPTRVGIFIHRGRSFYVSVIGGRTSD
jgi:hypothetical protein